MPEASKQAEIYRVMAWTPTKFRPKVQFFGDSDAGRDRQSNLGESVLHATTSTVPTDLGGTDGVSSMQLRGDGSNRGGYR